jgi:hypothetical protein
MKSSVSKRFFFEKKNQKTPASWEIFLERCRSRRKIEVFLLLFVHKKKCLRLRPFQIDLVRRWRRVWLA